MFLALQDLDETTPKTLASPRTRAALQRSESKCTVPSILTFNKRRRGKEKGCFDKKWKKRGEKTFFSFSGFLSSPSDDSLALSCLSPSLSLSLSHTHKHSLSLSLNRRRNIIWEKRNNGGLFPKTHATFLFSLFSLNSEAKEKSQNSPSVLSPFLSLSSPKLPYAATCALALQIAANASPFKLAPPTKKPSMSGFVASVAALPSLTDPP